MIVLFNNPIKIFPKLLVPLIVSIQIYSEFVYLFIKIYKTEVKRSKLVIFLFFVKVFIFFNFSLLNFLFILFSSLDSISEILVIFIGKL